MLDAVRKAVRDSEPVRSVRGAYYGWQFRRSAGTFSGVFRTFAEATASAPPNQKIGYDHDELADLYADRHFKVLPSDYPVLFWLERVFRGANSVFDFGGHLGIQYNSYRKYLEYPNGLRWTVQEVSAIVARGRALAAERGQTDLFFTVDFEGASDHDILLASGSIQYVETPFAERLSALKKLPRHLIINKTPLIEGEPFVTLQNVVHAFCPYAILNRYAFIDSLVALGYQTVDVWETPDMTCHLPLHPERSLDAYTGLYLRLPE